MAFWTKKQGHVIAPVLLFLFSHALCEHPDSTRKVLESNNHYFISAARDFDIDANILLSIVYVERTLNVDWKDDALDTPLASAGYNSSIGLCQVKLKTAYFIEKSLMDSGSTFFLGKKYKDLLNVSSSPKELIQKLNSDSLNIRYAAAYLRIIIALWRKAGYDISYRPDILGTLYSTGLFTSTGDLREPRARPKANRFGQLTLEHFQK